MNLTVGIVSRNLVTTLNFVKFRDNQNIHVFRGNKRNTGHLAHFEWITVCHVSGVELVNMSSSVGPTWTCGISKWMENPKWVDKEIQ